VIDNHVLTLLSKLLEEIKKDFETLTQIQDNIKKRSKNDRRSINNSSQE
jgi:hypothetical protein